MPEGMDGHLFGDARFLFGLLYGPLHAPLGIPAVKVQIWYFDVADFEAAETASVEQPDQNPVLEKFRYFEQALYLFPAKYHRQFLAALDGGQFDPFVFEAFDSVGKP